MRISDWSSDVCSSDLNRELLAGGNDIVLRAVLLQHHPLHPDVVLRVAPVAKGIEVAHEQAALQALRDVREPARDLRSEEHTSELQSLMRISYAVFCLKKKQQKSKNKNLENNIIN